MTRWLGPVGDSQVGAEAADISATDRSRMAEKVLTLVDCARRVPPASPREPHEPRLGTGGGTTGCGRGGHVPPMFPPLGRGVGAPRATPHPFRRRLALRTPPRTAAHATPWTLVRAHS